MLQLQHDVHVVGSQPRRRDTFRNLVQILVTGVAAFWRAAREPTLRAAATTVSAVDRCLGLGWLLCKLRSAAQRSKLCALPHHGPLTREFARCLSPHAAAPCARFPLHVVPPSKCCSHHCLQARSYFRRSTHTSRPAS